MRNKHKRYEMENDSNGWWAYCQAGWRNAKDSSHTFHEATKQELLTAIDHWLEPCKCDQCNQILQPTIKG